MRRNIHKKFVEDVGNVTFVAHKGIILYEINIVGMTTTFCFEDWSKEIPKLLRFSF